MVDFGSYMPMGAEQAKDRQDQRDADWDAALKEEMEAQLERLNAQLALGDDDAIQAVADQLCPVKIVHILCRTKNWDGRRILIEKEYFKAVRDAFEIRAIEEMGKR
jgi:hypothetical protein